MQNTKKWYDTIDKVTRQKKGRREEDIEHYHYEIVGVVEKVGFNILEQCLKQ